MKCFYLLFLILPVVLMAQPPSFGPVDYVKAGGNPITVTSGHANPCVVDWDGDGLKDLIIGQFSGGKIRFYKNSGTNEVPVFTDFSYLQADGSDISLSSG